MTSWQNDQIRIDESEGQIILEHEPRAVSAHYDREGAQIVITLADGSTCLFPVNRVQCPTQ